MPIIAPPTAAPPHVPTRAPRRTSTVGVVIAGLVLVAPVLALTLATWGVITARQTTVEQRDIEDPWLSTRDRAALGLPSSATTMFSPGAAVAVAQALDTAIAAGGAPTSFTQISLYPDDAIAVARDADRPDQVDQYAWVAGRVGPSSPHPAVDDLDRLTFTVDEVDWSAVSRLAGSAVAMSGVEDGTITHVIVDRSPSDEQAPVTIRIYVSGPHSSGFVEASATGIVLDVY